MKNIFLMVIFFLSFSAFAAEKDTEHSSVSALWVAHVEKISLMKLDPRPNMLVASNEFQVTISNIQVIHGEDAVIKGKIKVTIYADDLFEIKRAGDIALLVDNHDKKSVKVLAWEPIRKFACFSEDLVEKKYADHYWGDRLNNQRKCVFVNNRIDSLKYDDDQ